MVKQEIEKMEYLESMYSKIGYECIPVSVKEKTGLETLKSLMKDKISSDIRQFRCWKNNLA